MVKIKNWKSLRLNGKKVFLRAVRKKDARRIFELVNDPDITRFLATIEAPVLLKQEKNYVLRSEQGWKKGKSFNFAICEKKSGVLAGVCGFHDYNSMHHRAEAGLWVAKEHWKKGFGSEAISLLVDFGFRTLKLHRVRYEHIVQNKGSKGIAEKVGFKKEGLVRDFLFKRGEYWNVFTYGLLESEWKKKFSKK